MTYFNLGGYIFNSNYLQSIRKCDSFKNTYQIILNKNLDSEEVFEYNNTEDRDRNYCKLVECIEKNNVIDTIR